jgi:hypothetical protein
MPLILAIEPDCVRAAHLAALALEQVSAELVIVETADLALAAMHSRMPDMVLAPARLNAAESTALVVGIRAFEAAGEGPPLLITPTLGLGERVQTIFAMQINELLARRLYRKPEPDEPAATADGETIEALEPIEALDPDLPIAVLRPAEDEWGMFDPDQCGFKALMERVRHLTASEV